MQQPRRSSLGSEPNGSEKRQARRQAPLVTTKACGFAQLLRAAGAQKKSGEPFRTRRVLRTD